MLTPDDLACFGSAVSERDLTIAGAEAGVLLVKKGLERSGQDATARQRLRLHNYLAGLYLWKWRLSNAPAALTESISHLRQATEIAEQMKTSGERRPLGRIAKVYLQLLVALRQQDGTCKRQDSEGCLNAIIALDESSAMDPRDASYLRWYKAIAYADSGLEDAVRETVLQTVQADVMISRQAKENTVEIGQKQYAVLRRFITDNLPFFKHQALLGYISQALQSASQHRWESPNS
jgi:hypothetical protein